MSIHPTAIVHRGAEIDASAEVGPFCILGPRVKVGARTVLQGHVVLQGRVTLGCDNVVHSFAVLGGEPQDRKYRGEPARLQIGDHNVIREYVTMNIGTEADRMETRVGNHCLFMASSHVAHDCSVGDDVVMANGVALAGHVELHDHAILGGLAAIHQFCRVGRLAFVGGGAMVAQDVPPFCVAQGDRATLAGLNMVGLRRAGLPRVRLQRLYQAFRALFFGSLPRAEALQGLDAHETDDESILVRELCAFVRAAPRGVCGPRRKDEPPLETAENVGSAPSHGHG